MVLCRQHKLRKLVQWLCTTNLHVCRSILSCQSNPVNVVKFLAHNWAQLYSSTETVLHATRTVQRDWPASCCCARNCDELASNFTYKFLAQGS